MNSLVFCYDSLICKLSLFRGKWQKIILFMALRNMHRNHISRGIAKCSTLAFPLPGSMSADEDLSWYFLTFWKFTVCVCYLIRFLQFNLFSPLAYELLTGFQTSSVTWHVDVAKETPSSVNVNFLCSFQVECCEG